MNNHTKNAIEWVSIVEKKLLSQSTRFSGHQSEIIDAQLRRAENEANNLNSPATINRVRAARLKFCEINSR